MTRPGKHPDHVRYRDKPPAKLCPECGGIMKFMCQGFTCTECGLITEVEYN